jgi:hypothetical protein
MKLSDFILRYIPNAFISIDDGKRKGYISDGLKKSIKDLTIKQFSLMRGDFSQAEQESMLNATSYIIDGNGNGVCVHIKEG